jgi:hypothetical protein
MPSYFFPCTNGAVNEITKLFDFTWPTAAALWNLRWQVNGFLSEIPTASPAQLNDRFVFGSNIHGANLRRACSEITWDDQKSMFASFILTNAFAIYECWADEILQSVGSSSIKGIRLQFDDTPGKVGLPGTIASLCATESITLRRAYFPVFSGTAKYSSALMPNLLKCYRYFKEARNAQIHRGGLANDRDEEVYRQFAPVSDKTSLGMRGVLVHEPLVSGQVVKLHIRGVVGFCDILLRLMSTVDADLCKSIKTEPVFERMVRAAGGARRMLSTRIERRNRQVVKICTTAGLPRPADVGAVYDFLRAKRIVVV